MENIVNSKKAGLAKSNKWFVLIVLILGGGTIFKLSSLKDAFYLPMQTYFGLNHTQIGLGLSVYAIIQTIGYTFSIYIADRFSKRFLIPGSLIGTGLIGLYLATFPGYYGYLASFGALAIFGEVTYWPVLLKAVRLLGSSDEQGRLFGFLEAGRGIVDTIVAFSALAIFAALGAAKTGFRSAILFYSVVVMVVGVVSFFLIEDDKIRDTDHAGRVVGKNKVAFEGMMRAVKSPEIWAAAFTVFSVYSIYAGLTSFIPFLSEIYGLPVTLVGAYGIINQYGLKMIGGPAGGFLADKVVKSASRYLRYGFIAAALAMTGFIMLPHESMNVYLGMTATLSFGAIIFSMRAVFFAPMDEVKVPREITGAAMSIGSLIGYFPSVFAYTMYGSMLDKNPGITGYRNVFMTMTGFAVLGIVISSILIWFVKKKQNQATVS